MHFYPFNPSRYYLATGHWSEDRAEVTCEAGLLRDLAYRRLLDLYYGKEEPIPSKTRLVAIRIRMLKHEEIVASVLKEKFTLIDGFWRQDVADEEVLRYQRRAAASRENGKKGGRPKTNGEPKKTQQVPDGLQLRTRTRTKRNTPLPPEGELWFEEFWKACPRKVGKPDAERAFGKALARGATMEKIMAGLRAHLPGWEQKKAGGEGDKIPHPATWLNRDGWNDEVMPSGGPGAADQPGRWWNGNAKGWLDKGLELGLPAPPQPIADHPMQFLRFRASVMVAAGDGPWWDDKDTAYALAVRMRNEGATHG